MKEQYKRRMLFEIVLKESQKALIYARQELEPHVERLQQAECVFQLGLSQLILDHCHEMPGFLRKYTGDLMQDDFYNSLDDCICKIEGLYAAAEAMNTLRRKNPDCAHAEYS
ncbi:hypothetical protein KY363_04265 [Candidatus Woesearchaeota archaeon]|nr:hypothetical protein [Candidatus Woesearchaeota archaeon]